MATISGIYAFKKLEELFTHPDDDISEMITLKEIETILNKLETYMISNEFQGVSLNVKNEYAIIALKTNDFINGMKIERLTMGIFNFLNNISSLTISRILPVSFYRLIDIKETDENYVRLKLKKLKLQSECSICYEDSNENVFNFDKIDRVCNTCLGTLCVTCFNKSIDTNNNYKCIMCRQIYKTSFLNEKLKTCN